MVQVQDDNTLNDLQVGFKDVLTKDLTFDQCMVWDIAVPQKTMTIAPGAGDIRIRGGIVARTGGLFVNNATSRSVYVESDEWNAPSYGTEPLTSSIFVNLGRRKGGWEPGAFTGWGMTSGAWTNHAVGGAGTPLTIAYADGTVGHSFPTGAWTGNGAGVRFPKLVTCRGWNPIYKIKFRLHNATSNRILFGWAGSTTFETSIDLPLTNLHGIALGSRAADTSFVIFHNSAVGVGSATSTGITMDTAIHTFELVAQDDFANKFKYAIDGVWTDLVSSNIPGQSIGLAPYAQIATSTTAARGFDLFAIYVESK